MRFVSMHLRGAGYEPANLCLFSELIYRARGLGVFASCLPKTTCPTMMESPWKSPRHCDQMVMLIESLKAYWWEM